MSTLFRVSVQRPHSARANPVNYRRWLVVSAPTESDAKRRAEVESLGVGESVLSVEALSPAGMGRWVGGVEVLM